MATAAGLQATVLRLIAAYGAPATWRSITRSYSSSTLTATETIVNHVVTIVMGHPKERGYRSGETNTLKEDTDIAYLAASGLAFEPKVSDRVEFAGVEWTALRVTDVRFQATTLAYEVEVRR